MASLDACSGGGGPSANINTGATSTNLIDQAFRLGDESDAITDDAFFTAQRSEIVPTVGSATYRGHVILGDFGPEPENADDLGGEEPGGEAAIARATMTANFANSTVTGAATDFIGATFGPSLPTVISDDVTLQEGRDPVLSNGRRYTGSVTFNGSLDAGDRSGVTGTFTGTLRSNSHTFDLNEVATGEIRGADNDYLEIESNRITEGDNSREISVEFFGEQ